MGNVDCLILQDRTYLTGLSDNLSFFKTLQKVSILALDNFLKVTAMICAFALLFLAIASMPVAPRPSHAGPNKDEFLTCLVEKTSTSDRTVFFRWLVRVINSHPDVQQMSGLSGDERSKIDRDAAAYIERLVAIDCAGPGQQAAKLEGVNVVVEALRHLGKSTMAGVMQNPVVASEGQAFAQYLDKAKLAASLGLPPGK